MLLNYLASAGKVHLTLFWGKNFQFSEQSGGEDTLKAAFARQTC